MLAAANTTATDWWVVYSPASGNSISSSAASSSLISSLPSHSSDEAARTGAGSQPVPAICRSAYLAACVFFIPKIPAAKSLPSSLRLDGLPWGGSGECKGPKPDGGNEGGQAGSFDDHFRHWSLLFPVKRSWLLCEAGASAPAFELGRTSGRGRGKMKKTWGITHPKGERAGGRDRPEGLTAEGWGDGFLGLAGRRGELPSPVKGEDDAGRAGVLVLREQPCRRDRYRIRRRHDVAAFALANRARPQSGWRNKARRTTREILFKSASE